MNLQRLILFFLLLLNSFLSSATHIVGGEMNYRHLGGNNYEIRLTLYRDCFNGVPPFDDPASVGIYNSANQLVNLTYNYTGWYPMNSNNPTYYNNAVFNNQIYGYLIHPNDSQPVPNIINDPCMIPPTNICYSVCHYIDTVYLPPIPGGYHLVYQRCCRNFSISNIVNPLDVGATYDAWIPAVPYDDDSNPSFNAWPPTYICVNEPFIFDHSATDFEGDSLVYQLCDPVDGPNNPCWYDNLCCQVTPQPCGPMPQPPYTPPYINVIWQPPYSLANVFGGTPLAINPQTGLLTATPNAVGQYVYAVCVIEYRNGVPIGQTRRDFQVNIVVCANITVSSIQSPTIACGLNLASFTNNSTGASSYYWNFGDTTTLGDTSHLFQPSYSYPDTGWYSVMLIAYSSVNPGCDDTSFGNVYVYPALAAGFTFQVLPCTRTVVFNDTASVLSGLPNSWYWNFGDGNTSTQANPTHTYLNNGNYQVTLIMQTNVGCIDTITLTVPVNYVPFNAAFTSANVLCTNSFNFTNQSTGASSYNWNFGDASSSTLSNPSHTYASSGNYTVTLVASDTSGCSDTVSQVVATPLLAQANFVYQVDTCSLTVTFTNNSSNANAYSWNFGDASSSTQTNPVHTYASSGNYNVTLIATTGGGCDDTVAVPVALNISLPVAAFVVNQVLCSFSVNIINQSTGATSYSWDFGDNTTSTLQNPSHTYAQPGNYTITLVIPGVANCTDTITQNVIIDPLPSASFTQVLDTCALNVVFNNTSVNAASYLWSFGDASASTQTNPAHTYSASGNYTVTLTVTDNNGCTATATSAFTFPPLPVASFVVNPVLCSFNINITNQSTGATSYNWDFGDNTTSTLQNPSHTYALPGNYTITLVIPGVTSCADTVTQNITIDPLPSASFTEVLDTCGLSVAFNNTSANATSYSWNFGDASSSTQINPTHTYSASGNYTVTLTVTDNNGCTATSTRSFTFPPLPAASFTYQPDLCSRLVTFTNTSSNAINYSWDFGDAATSNLINPAHTYSANGNYNVTLVVTSAQGCTDTVVSPVAINYVPVVAAFTPVNALCSYNFNFTNQSTGASSYSWNFGDASTSTQTNPSHTYASSGNYTVTLIANDANGCGDTISQPVSMQPLAQANFIYQVDTCSLTVTFTNNSTNAGSYSWDFGDASISSLQNPVHTYAASGNYNVTLIATTAAGCNDTTLVPVPLSIVLPSAAFTINQPLCSFGINLINQSTGANNYIWDFGDATNSSLQNPSHTYAQPGNYTITLIISGVASCADTVTQSIIVNPLPTAAFTPVPDICSLTTSFNNNSVNGTSYLWNFGDATTSTQTNPIHTYSASGNYTVTLTTTDANGCTATSTQSFSFPPLPVSSFTHQADLCSRLVTFTNNSSYAALYAWSFGDATTSTVPNPTHTYAANGNYIVTLIVTSAGGCTDTLTAPVTINYTPVVAAFNVLNTPCTFYASFVNQSSGGTGYYWNFGDGYFSSQQNPAHTYSSAGNYIITLIATDANGCGDTTSQNISLPIPSQASFSYVADLCTRLVTFTNNSSNGNAYYWDFGDANTSAQANPSHIYAANGNYNVSLIATSPAGCNDTLVMPVPVNIILPVAAFTPNGNVCTFDVTFNNQSTNASTYAWNFGDNTTSNLANPTHVYPNAGNYTITLNVASTAGCVDSTVNNVGVAPVPVASFIPQVDTCTLVSHFFNTSQNAVNYWWNFGDSTTSVSGNPGPHTYSATGTYNVTLVVQDSNGCLDTLVRTINPFIFSQADYTYSIDTCEQQVSFFNQSDFAFAYRWDFGDGETSNEISNQHHYASDGNYPVLLITNPGTLCADTASYIVDFSMLGIGNIYVPNAFTPNSDGKNDIFEIVGYYPCEDLTLYIFNRWGELIYKKSGQHITWDGGYMDNSVKLEVYVYILEGTYFYQNGTITVIR